jgi:hypothetical protein
MSPKPIYRESIWISMLSTPLGIAAGLLVYLVALVILGDSLLGDNLGFWNRLYWAAPILIFSASAYIAPSYLMASYAKKRAALER